MVHIKAPLERLIRGALGEVKSDLVVTGGRLVNVYSGEILDGLEIAVLDGRICYVGPSAKHARGDHTEILDAQGQFVAPGFIDGHTHIGHYARPFEQLQSFLPHGTTAVVASCDELATVFGARGLKLFLDEVERHPLRVYTLVPMVAPQDPLLCNTATLSTDEITAAFDDPRVLGLGEIVSWLRLTQCDPELLQSIAWAREHRRIIHGHTAGARDQKLNAVAACGVSSCHEPIRVEDALERLRLGYWTMLREGSLRQDLEATLKPLLECGVHLQRLILVTDSMTPDDVEEHGHIDHVVRRAIALGLSPVHAIQSVTINPATYSGLDQEIGGVAPGRFADIVLIDGLENCSVSEVWIGGKRVAQGGVAHGVEAPIALPQEMMYALRLEPIVTPDAFKIAVPAGAAAVRVMSLVNQTITAERRFEIDEPSSVVAADIHKDLLKVAMFDRHHESGKIAFGLLQGWGMRAGAVGLTANLDENSLLVVGADDSDMAVCANALIESGGGIAIVQNAAVVEKIAFPLGGIFSLEPWTSVGRKLRGLQERLREMGSPFDKPLFPLTFLPFVTLPALRITARGLINVKERTVVSLFVNEDA